MLRSMNSHHNTQEIWASRNTVAHVSKGKASAFGRSTSGICGDRAKHQRNRVLVVTSQNHCFIIDFLIFALVRASPSSRLGPPLCGASWDAPPPTVARRSEWWMEAFPRITCPSIAARLPHFVSNSHPHQPVSPNERRLFTIAPVFAPGQRRLTAPEPCDCDGGGRDYGDSDTTRQDTKS